MHTIRKTNVFFYNLKAVLSIMNEGNITCILWYSQFYLN